MIIPNICLICISIALCFIAYYIRIVAWNLKSTIHTHAKIYRDYKDWIKEREK